jgi:hypothetical protein
MVCCVRGAFIIKCAGQNNFNTNHFRSSAISGLFKAFSLPILMYCSQRSIYVQKAAADSLLLLILATPSKFFMRPPWDSERPASFDFASLKQKKVRCSRIRQIKSLADHLDAFATIKSPGMRLQRSPLLRPSTKTSPGTTIWDFSASKLAGTSPEPS